jgi:predicted nucleic acid-binding protein
MIVKMTEDLCFDTNIILGYATDFEQDHDKCEKIFQDPRIKRICSRVHSEIGRIKARRLKYLYEDLIGFIKGGGDPTEFKPKCEIGDNDERHLRNLLGALSKNPPLDYVRRKRREIESGINNAFTKLKTPHIQPVHDTICENSINSCVPNRSDSQILSDALYWAEKNKILFFCTKDRADIIGKRDQIYKRITTARPYQIKDIPLKIFDLTELIH